VFVEGRYQVVEWAPAPVLVEWQEEHLVVADPPSNLVVPGVPWQLWQYFKSALA
jgi:hypothetical protein